jgi:Domain of unknown function (DUF4105)
LLRNALLRGLFWLTLLLAACASPARADEPPPIEAWLLTMGVGDGLWERFGHTAIRVSDGRNDVAYSFGAAPFSKPSFLWEFLRGEAEFMVVAEHTGTTLERYRKWDRTVWEQKLRLTPERALWLAVELASHTRAPKNRYRYDHIYDNCATRIRDLIDQASSGALRRAGMARVPPGRTFRDDMLDGVRGHWAGHLGADLISGPYEDVTVPDGWVEMYLPLALKDRVAEARLDDGTPLAEPMRALYTRQGPSANSEAPSAARSALMALAAAVMLLALASRHARAPEAVKLLAQVGMGALIVMLSVFGLVCVPLALLSRIPNLSPNYNAYLFVPFDLVFFGLTRGLADAGGAPAVSIRLLRYYAWRLGVVLVVAGLGFAGVLGQHNDAFTVAALCYVAGLGALAFRRGRAAAK